MNYIDDYLPGVIENDEQCDNNCGKHHIIN